MTSPTKQPPPPVLPPLLSAHWWTMMRLSNSQWLSLLNMILCLLTAVTPMFSAYPRATWGLLLAYSVLFWMWKALTGTLPPPKEPTITTARKP